MPTALALDSGNTLAVQVQTADCRSSGEHHVSEVFQQETAEGHPRFRLASCRWLSQGDRLYRTSSW